ncbi:hypothetical protein, partial [Wolbachia pipientis]
NILKRIITPGLLLPFFSFGKFFNTNLSIKKFTKRKKRQKKPDGWLVTYIILSSMAFFYSKRLITVTQPLLSRN